MHHEYFTTDKGRRLDEGDYCQSDVVAGQPPQVTGGMVARAFQRIPVPASALAVAPVDGETLVTLPTVFWTRAEPFRRTVTLLGQRVTLDITPSSFRWDYGDGSAATSDSPGLAFTKRIDPASSRYQSHVYDDGGVVHPAVDVTWSARWSLNGGPFRAVDGTVTIAGRPVDLRVLTAEVRSD